MADNSSKKKTRSAISSTTEVPKKEQTSKKEKDSSNKEKDKVAPNDTSKKHKEKQIQEQDIKKEPSNTQKEGKKNKKDKDKSTEHKEDSKEKKAEANDNNTNANPQTEQKEKVKTSKSRKKKKRDKPKHSAKLMEKNHGEPKKGGFGGKGAWGKAGDEIKYQDDAAAIDSKDPNYDPEDIETPNYTKENKAMYEEYVFSSKEASSLKFASSIEDLNKFKKSIKDAAEEYFYSLDQGEFVQCVKDLNLPIYYAEIPVILMRMSFDKPAEARKSISSLLLFLVNKVIISRSHMAAAFTKMYNSIEDILLDAPQARTILQEYMNKAVVGGYLDLPVKEKLETSDREAKNDPEKVLKTKAKIADMVRDFFAHPNIPEVINALKELNCSHLHFEFIKKLVSVAFDQSNFHRELASRLLARVAGDLIATDQVIKGFVILLQRVEDLYLDVPSILGLLSRFIARAVEDEALPPIFLVQQDLLTMDMGYQVIREAQNLLKKKGSGKRMRFVWLAPKPNPNEEKKTATDAIDSEKSKTKTEAIDGGSSSSSSNSTSTSSSSKVESIPKQSRANVIPDEDDDDDEPLEDVDLIDNSANE